MDKQLIIPAGEDATKMVIAPAVRIGNLLFLSGTAGTRDGKLAGDDIQSQSRAALERLGKVLAAAGSSFDKVVKVNCFLVYPERDFGGWNTVFKEFFPSNPPARTTVGGGIAMPGALVEVECVATV
jgi:2-iminobutanoate/2-iminopropanoate deaminase